VAHAYASWQQNIQQQEGETKKHSGRKWKHSSSPKPILNGAGLLKMEGSDNDMHNSDATAQNINQLATNMPMPETIVFPGSVRFSFYPKFATDLTEPGYQYFTF